MPSSIIDVPMMTIVLLFGIMILAGFVHGALGLGFPMIATPFLSLIFDVRTAILLTLLPTVVVNIASILREKNWGTSARRFWPLMIYALLGSFAGSLLIVENDPAPYKLILALLIFLFLAAGYFSSRYTGVGQNHPALAMVAFGLIAGLAAGTTNVMVPILIIYTMSLGMTTAVMVQVFNMTFLAGKLAQISVFGFEGLIDVQLLQITAPMALVGFGALVVGMLVRDHISTETFRSIIKTLLVLMAVTLIGQYVHYLSA
jgi:uncharacterized membrane protein YfcA